MEITLRETERQKRRMADLKSASANALNSVFMQLRQQLSKLWQRAAANYPRVAEVGSTRGGLGNAGGKWQQQDENKCQPGWQTLFGLLKFL